MLGVSLADDDDDAPAWDLHYNPAGRPSSFDTDQHVEGAHGTYINA